MKVFNFVQLFGDPFYLLDEILPNSCIVNTANKILKIYSVKFCFFLTPFIVSIHSLKANKVSEIVLFARNIKKQKSHIPKKFTNGWDIDK